MIYYVAVHRYHRDREARNLSSTPATGCNIQSTAVVVSKVAKGNFICFRIILCLKTERAALLMYYFTVIYVIVALILSLIPCFESHEEVFVMREARDNSHENASSRLNVTPALVA